MALLTGLFDDMLFATVPALGFALLFNVPPKALKYCALGGALGHGSRYLLLTAGMPIEWATFAAATLVGVLGAYWARRFLAHPKVFTVAAVIPMIPGIYAYKAMVALVEISQQGYTPELWGSLVANFIKAMFIVAGLAIGLAMPGLLFYRRRPLV